MHEGVSLSPARVMRSSPSPQSPPRSFSLSWEVDFNVKLPFPPPNIFRPLPSYRAYYQLTVEGVHVNISIQFLSDIFKFLY